MDSFYDQLGLALATRGVALNPDGSLSLDPTFTGSDPISGEQVALYNERRDMQAVKSEVERQWAHDLAWSIDRIVANDSPDLVAVRVVFYLRLHGWLVDFRQSNAIVFTALREAGTPTPTSVLHFFAFIARAIDGIIGALSEDELLYAEYRRHVDAHIAQGAYEPQWMKKKGAVRRAFTSKFTGKDYEVGDLNQRLASVIRLHQTEPRIAYVLAERLQLHAAALEQALVQFTSPQYHRR